MLGLPIPDHPHSNSLYSFIFDLNRSALVSYVFDHLVQFRDSVHDRKHSRTAFCTISVPLEFILHCFDDKSNEHKCMKNSVSL